MNENLTEIAIILDRSGSMAFLRNETITALNNFLSEQKGLPGEVFFTAALFNDSYKLLYDRLDINRAGPVTEKEYIPRGRGALNDAFGKTIDDTGFILDATPEPERPRKVALFVVSGGDDNASSLYSKEKLAAMVDLQIKTYSWEFLFFGVNTDSRDGAASIGIPADRAFNVSGNAEGIVGALKAASAAARNLRKYRALYAEGAPDFRQFL